MGYSTRKHFYAVHMSFCSVSWSFRSGEAGALNALCFFSLCRLFLAEPRVKARAEILQTTVPDLSSCRCCICTAIHSHDVIETLTLSC